MNLESMAKLAKEASLKLISLSEEQRKVALLNLADSLEDQTQQIIEENKKDLLSADQLHLSGAMKDRLRLDEKSLQSMAKSVREIANFPQVVGIREDKFVRPNGLMIEKHRIPIGVIGMIFESRPNVVIDGISLAIKSGNAMILKGGKEASFSNKILFNIALNSTKDILPEGSLSLIETREDVMKILKLHDYIDLMVPRGGSELIRFVRAHATMPVVAHDKGLCHIYVDEKSINPTKIILNSKVQRPGVCNAVESLLIHKNSPFVTEIIEALLKEQVEIRGCEKSLTINSAIIPAKESDYETEYLDKIISFKLVSSTQEAIDHIKKYSSHHTEAIISEDEGNIKTFINSLDSSAIMVNASTRFNDGGELGLGAELGISTSKLHAYGPMGAKEMTTTRFLVTGNGQVR